MLQSLSDPCWVLQALQSTAEVHCPPLLEWPVPCCEKVLGWASAVLSELHVLPAAQHATQQKFGARASRSKGLPALLCWLICMPVVQ